MMQRENGRNTETGRVLPSALGALALLTMGAALVSACAQAVPTLAALDTQAAGSPAQVGGVTPSSTPLSQVQTSAASEAPNPAASRTPASSPTPARTHTPSPAPTVTGVPATPTPQCTESRGRIEFGTFSSAIIGQDRAYRIYLPPCYDSEDTRYPVLYMLHGYPFDDSHWDELGIDEAADAGIAAGSLPPLIIAMPAADNEGTYTRTSGGQRSFEGVILDEFMPFIESRYRTTSTAQGRAIGGMSRGAVWSLEIAFRNPAQFAAVGGHSAALNVNQAPQMYDPIYLAADPAIRSLRIYLDAGRADWVLPGVEQLHAALSAAGVAHEYHLYDGSHDNSYWSAHVADYLAFYTADW